jgi:hypothetical protein
MKTHNAKRKGHAFPKNVDEARRDFIRARPCLATGKRTGQLVYFDPTWMPRTWLKASPWRCYVVCAHVKSRGSGGKDVANMVPLDSRIHDWQGVIGWPEFERRLRLIPRAEIAARYEKGYQLEQGGVPVLSGKETA